MKILKKINEFFIEYGCEILGGMVFVLIISLAVGFIYICSVESNKYDAKAKSFEYRIYIPGEGTFYTKSYVYTNNTLTFKDGFESHTRHFYNTKFSVKEQ